MPHISEVRAPSPPELEINMTIRDTPKAGALHNGYSDALMVSKDKKPKGGRTEPNKVRVLVRKTRSDSSRINKTPSILHKRNSKKDWQKL